MVPHCDVRAGADIQPGRGSASTFPVQNQPITCIKIPLAFDKLAEGYRAAKLYGLKSINASHLTLLKMPLQERPKSDSHSRGSH